MTACEEAKLRALLHLQDRSGIGTLGERSLHAVLKYWIEPDERRHEVKLPCGLVADIYDGERVVEIQTGSLYQLRGKLDRRLVELDLVESRARDGWGRDGKRGSHRVERVPVAVGRELWLQGPADCVHMLPDGLPIPFTTADFQKAGRLSAKKAGFAINFLYKNKVIVRTGKSGRAYLYAAADGDAI